nr:DUF177 domain-containing protein [Lachnospiraceae bacterium]
MLYNLTDIFSSEGKEEKLTTAYEAKVVTVQSEEFPICECSGLSLTLTNKVKGEVLLKGRISLVCEIPCGRCLKPVRVPLELELEENLKESMIGTPEAADEMSFVEGYELDTDALVGNEILINWPMKVLCREDCKGICTVCGKDLNEGDCGCDTFVPDPRMAVIKDIFNA